MREFDDEAIDTALELAKVRLNRLDDALDEYLRERIRAAAESLERTGIALNGESTADIMLVCDSAVWEYQNRDKNESMPEWLRLKRRERWLNERRDAE